MNRIDAKGRVSVPAHFRAVLARRGTSELYALSALDLPAMDVGAADLLDRYEARIEKEDPFGQSFDDMSFFIHGDGMFLKLDQDGRMSVSEAIRSHTGIRDEVAFVGRGSFFQMWEPGRLSDYREIARARLRARKDSAGDGRMGEGTE